MSKKSTKALASAALMSLVLTTALSAGPVKAAQGKVTRVSGADRYATASQVATANWESGSDSVVLVSGEGYADAVSASALAKKLGAPILLTEPGSLNADAQKALDTLKPKNVYVIGGNASISQSIRDGLKDKYTLTELGGANRYETNAAVADELVKLGVDASNVLVVGGEGFSDALSVAPVAAAKGQILLLATNDQAKTQPVIDFVKKNNSKATVVGTKNIINDTIYNALGASSRVDGGADRFATNIKVLTNTNFQGDLKSDKVYIANASKATPDNLYADALVASAVAGKYSAPLVLVDKDPSGSTTNPNATDNAIAYLKDNTTSSTDFQVIGGTGVVSENTVGAINEIYNPTPDGDQADEVESIESVGLRQIKVTFNGEVDSDTAEEVTNYKVDGTSLKDNVDNATLQDDNKTVLITLSDARKQNDDVDVTVKKGILSADKSNTIPEFTQTVTFADTTAPTVSSVEAKGTKKLVVQFSEPVFVGTSENVNKIASKLKINGSNLSSFGLDTTGKDGNGKYLSKLDNVANSTGSEDDNLKGYWSDKAEFYFNSDLPVGNNTLKVSDGDEDALEDAAGFPVAETTIDFDVDSLSSKPVISSITAEDDGTVYVNFDRPMDAKTATEADNYRINSDDSDDNGNFDKAELKKGDTQVKISGAHLNKNSNKIYISDNVEDAYGNNVEDDTYKSFDLDEDSVKPTVTSVYALDDSTIRVRFSKDVDADYATNLSNYKLLDSDGTNITYQIDGDNIKVPGDDDATTGSVFDLPLKDTYKLSDSKYTITIKNIQDKASSPNVMDDYTTTFDGSDEVNAEVTGVYKVSGSDTKVTLVFNKEMDASTLDDTDNYKYVNKKGDSAKVIPSSSDITVSSNNKSVTIDLGGSLTTEDVEENDAEDIVTGIYATGVKDADGNSLDVGNNGGEFKAAADSDYVKANSLRLYYKGNDLKADVSFETPVDADTLTDDEGNDLAGNFKLSEQPADSASVDGNKVTLTFNKNNDDDSIDTTKINEIKKDGIDALLTIDGTDIKDVTGSPLVGTLKDSSAVKPYFYEAAPRTIVNDTDWTAKKVGAGAEVQIKFDTPIDSHSVKPGDFTFNVGGTNIEADNAEVSDSDERTVIFTFDDGSDFIAGKKLTIKPKSNSTSTISTLKDDNGNYAYYTPSDDDNDGIEVTIKAAEDATAPTLSAATATGTTETGATLNFTSDEAGTYYYVVYAVADPAPDKTAVVAQGTAVAKGTAVASAAANTASVTGLTTGTSYKAYVVVEDAAGNISDVSTIDINTL